MSWISKLFRGRKKEVVLEGGFEVLQRLTGGAISRSDLLGRYSKSLYVFACVSKIAEKVASIPLEMYRVINSRGDVKEIPAHPLLDLLYKPNPFQTRTEFWELAIINLKCTGEAFWYKVRNTKGQVVELWNLRPDIMKVVADPTSFVKEYRMQKADGSETVFEPEDIIHFKNPDPTNPLAGMSPLKPAAQRIQTEEYATNYQRDFFLNSARPDAVIKSPDQNLDKEQKDDIREGWEMRHKGVGKTSKIAILEGGLDYQVISLSQKEMDYIESLKFTRDDILVAFKIPKVILSIVEDVNRANAETGMAIFLSETVKPEVDKMVEKINEQMVIPDFGSDLYIEAEDPTPANRELELKEYETGIRMNYLLINEVRALEGLPPVKGGWTMYMPIVNAPVGGLTGAEKAKMMKMGGASEAEAYEGGAPDKAKRFDFRGRYWLLKKFELHEAMLKAVAQGLKKADRKGKKTSRKVYVPMIKDAEIKKLYAEALLKRIDAGTKGFQERVTEFAREQGGRVIADLDKAKGKGKKITVKVSAIFDKAKEDGLLISLATPEIAALVEQAGKDALEMTAPAVDFLSTKRVQAFIKKRAEEMAESVNSTTLEKLDRTLAEGISAGEGIVDLRLRVEEVYKEFPLHRAEMIARTEATAANAKGTIEGFKQSDVANGKEWINSGDGRVREEHVILGGEIVGLDEKFSNGLAFPQEPNCRCVIGPAFLEQ